MSDRLNSMELLKIGCTFIYYTDMRKHVKYLIILRNDGNIAL